MTKKKKINSHSNGENRFCKEEKEPFEVRLDSVFPSVGRARLERLETLRSLVKLEPF